MIKLRDYQRLQLNNRYTLEDNSRLTQQVKVYKRWTYVLGAIVVFMCLYVP